MDLSLTPQILEAAYEYLRACPPFANWGLPEGEEVEFAVIGHRDRYGHYTRYQRTEDHIIVISSKCVGSTGTLLEIMAHEMCHLAQAVRKTESKKTMHNAEFYRLAAQVCAIHGWDFKRFA